MKLLKPDNPEILSVVVMKENKIIAQTQQTEILYPQYSIMKSLVALVIGNLLENQKLTLETTVGEVLNTGNVPISNISLEKLLSMQSGMQEKLLFADRTTCKDYIKACCEMNVKNKQEFLYNNACAYLAGRMAETQEKISLESQIINMLFKPCHLYTS
ncbi:MAG: serine hydrolase, partial [Oscillospiraceae bacterium]|nr:serine hydrolase [Oscillospiraceae bacterium]